MTVAVNHRQLIIDDFIDRFEAMQTGVEGVDRNYNLVTVCQDLKLVEQVDASKCPWVSVIGSDGTGTPQLGNSEQDTMDVIVLVYVKPDAARFPSQTAPQLLEAVMCDLEAAFNADPSCGGRVFRSTINREVDHDMEGRYSLAALTFSLSYNVKRTA
jgi:hypothetical protein